VNQTADPGFRLLTLGRACAWALLLSGWIGVGSFAMVFSSSTFVAFTLVAVWLLGLGAAAAIGTRGGISRHLRTLALLIGALLTVCGLNWSVRGGGIPAVLLSLVSWAVLTALASGVVRSLRLMHRALPEPPVLAAGVGALIAGIFLGDPGDLPALSVRLSILVIGLSLLMAFLQYRVAEKARSPGCRAGLFDCSLPAWPTGAWRDLEQWPLLLSGLAMLPMMAGLPLMADWCRTTAIAPQLLLMLHLAAMFGVALVLRPWLAGWSLEFLSLLCTVLLAAGALLALVATQPWDLLGLALTHGAAWGLSWSGQLWAPARRGQQNSSPLRAAAGYAALTVAFGLAVDAFGPMGLTSVHVAISAGAILALLMARLGKKAEI